MIGLRARSGGYVSTDNYGDTVTVISLVMPLQARESVAPSRSRGELSLTRQDVAQLRGRYLDRQVHGLSDSEVMDEGVDA